MKERPILFCGPMVAAILAGRKSQTRRIVKPQPVLEADQRMHWKGVGYSTHRERVEHFMREHCPYGRPGDRLWVRETWAVRGLAHVMQPSQAAKIASRDAWRYQADDATGWQHGWKPSIHMPRAASRITLEIIGVRVERLQDISGTDVLEEGIGPDALRRYYRDLRYQRTQERSEFDGPGDVEWDWEADYRSLWESINGTGSWEANPWVWAVQFKRVAP